MRYIIALLAVLLIAASSYAERFEFSSFPGIEIPRDDSVGI
jgi:hypothetical protein